MHACDLVELAGQLSYGAAAFVEATPAVAGRHLAGYWSASRCRLDRWGMALRDYAVMSESPRAGQAERLWLDIRPILTEILLSEMLTRVWTGVSAAYDRRFGSAQMEPVARSIHVAHLEARHRLLSLLVFGRGFAIQDAVVLNRLRRRVESWTDSLLAPIQLMHEVGGLAFHKTRCREFASDLAEQRRVGLAQTAEQLARASLRDAFQSVATIRPANPGLNQDIATAVRGCVQRSSYNAEPCAPDWIERMLKMADEAQEMIDQLQQLDDLELRSAGET